MIAAFTGSADFALEKTEAHELATAAANVARHYEIGGASEIVTDWCNLAMCLGIVYGPRLYAVMGKRRQTKPTATETRANVGKVEPAPAPRARDPFAPLSGPADYHQAA